jgi:hypothetical protein
MAAAEMSWGTVTRRMDEEEGPRARVFRNSGPLVVPPGTVLEVPILVFGIGAPIADVSVSLHIRHRAIGTLTIGLVSPDARATLLAGLERGNETSLGESCARPIVFTDAAPFGLADGIPPFAGPHRPAGSLAAFRGLRSHAANGCWRIVISDIGRSPVGALVACAALTIRA